MPLPESHGHAGAVSAGRQTDSAASGPLAQLPGPYAFGSAAPGAPVAVASMAAGVRVPMQLADASWLRQISAAYVQGCCPDLPKGIELHVCATD